MMLATHAHRRTMGDAAQPVSGHATSTPKRKRGARVMPKPTTGGDAAHEQWLEIPGFPDYSVSHLGRVKSHARMSRPGKGGGRRPVPECILKPSVDRDGYSVVCLSRKSRGEQYFVHEIVLMAFVGPRPPGYHTSHLDGDSRNNTLDNLAWEPGADNNRRRRDHGTLPMGERVHTARLTEADVRDIRKRAVGAKRGIYADLARARGVSPSCIKAVVYRKTWKHITP